MSATPPPPPDRSTGLLEAETMLRGAGRLLEHIGVADEEIARLSGVVFRLASRLQTDRLERVA